MNEWILVTILLGLRWFFNEWQWEEFWELEILVMAFSKGDAIFGTDPKNSPALLRDYEDQHHPRLLRPYFLGGNVVLGGPREKTLEIDTCVYPSSHNHGSGKWVPPILVSFHLG